MKDYIYFNVAQPENRGPNRVDDNPRKQAPDVS